MALENWVLPVPAVLQCAFETVLECNSASNLMQVWVPGSSTSLCPSLRQPQGKALVLLFPCAALGSCHVSCKLYCRKKAVTSVSMP